MVLGREHLQESFLLDRKLQATSADEVLDMEATYENVMDIDVDVEKRPEVQEEKVDTYNSVAESTDELQVKFAVRIYLTECILTNKNSSAHH